jgi:hypothetical protein
MKFIKTLAVISTLLFTFSAGAITAGVRQWFLPIVTVDLVNRSGQPVTKLSVIVETKGYDSNISVRNVPVDASQTVRFVLAGEGSYQIRATLADGTILNGGAGYVEAGYNARETLLPNKVESKYLRIF